jgi:hypothetical protein
LLGANRDDSTYLFQMFHPFTIVKAKSVLEKYRINNDSSKRDDDNTTVNPTTNTTVKHETDLFYNVLCERVEQTLRTAGIDPIKDRGASYGQIFYVLFMLCGLFGSFIYYIQVCFALSFFCL